MASWILLLASATCAGVGYLVRHRLRPTVPAQELQSFVARLAEEVVRAGEEYRVRGLVPDSFTMVISVHGQEVPVPLENLHRHYVAFPDQLRALVQQLLAEIEEVALERPEDHIFADAAMRILPRIHSDAWVAGHAPAFGDHALVQREIGPGLRLCYVMDDPWSVVYLCHRHLALWGRSEDDIFHLAEQNLRRQADAPQEAVADPERVGVEAEAAARALLLDPEAAEGLLLGLENEELHILGPGCDDLSQLMARSPGDVFRVEDARLVSLTDADPGPADADPDRSV